MKKTISLLVLGAFAAVMVAGLTHVALRLRMIRVGYALGEKTKERRDLEEEHRKLLLEQSLLRSPERIEKLAHEKLGMTRPDPAHIRVVKVGGKPELAQR
jgi:cell division protein FtsL